jgi:hypothetical protein
MRIKKFEFSIDGYFRDSYSLEVLYEIAKLLKVEAKKLLN